MLNTEKRNPKSTHIDKMTTLEMVKVMQEEMKSAVNTVDPEMNNISDAIDVITEGINNGGRLIYMGCGTSGRLGVLDASECPPTFGVSPELVVGIIAGGDKCLRSASENEEDKGEHGVADLININLSKNDVVVGLSVAGGAEYILEGLKYASSIGCKTIGITSNKGSLLDKISDISICPDTGAEVITGSTRMKAGTVQKIILNMLSTAAMIKQGHVYENLMINLKPTNIKLAQRCINIVMTITGKTQEEAKDALEKSNWVIKEAVKIL